MSNSKSFITSTETGNTFPSDWRKFMHDESLNRVKLDNDRIWMKKHGKKFKFNNETRSKLRSMFKELDTDSSGLLSVEEVYETLLSLGIVHEKAQVETIFKKVSSDSSGLIGFKEFLKIFEDLDTQNQKSPIWSEIFKDKNNEEGDLPLSLRMSIKRRSMMMGAILGQTQTEKERGRKVINAYSLETTQQSFSPSKTQRHIWRNSSKFSDVKDRIKLYKKRHNSMEEKLYQTQTSRSWEKPKIPISKCPKPPFYHFNPRLKKLRLPNL